MSVTRVTQSSVNALMLRGLQSDLSRLQQLQQNMSSGRRINLPSDDPVGTDSDMLLRGQLRRSQQYQRNASDGIAWLGTADQAMQSGVNLLIKVQSLVTQAISGAADNASRGAIAVEVQGIRGSMLSVANTTYLGRPIFGGTTNASKAYVDTGSAVTYQGDDGAVKRTVADGTSIQVNMNNAEVFGPTGGDVFTMLGKITQDLNNGDTGGLSNDLTAVTTARQRMSSALADEGSRYNRVDAMKNAATAAQVAMKGGLSQVEDLDVTKAVVELQTREAAYQAALSATAKIIQPSLVDFLR